MHERMKSMVFTHALRSTCKNKSNVSGPIMPCERMRGWCVCLVCFFVLSVAIASEKDPRPISSARLTTHEHWSHERQHGIDHPAIIVEAPVLECECTEYSHVDINASSCTEGGQVDFFVSMRGLVPGFVYEFEVKWTLDDKLTHTWKSVMENTEKDYYTLREPLMQRNDEFPFGMMAWDAYKQGDDRFWIDVTVCDKYPGLTTEEALIGTRNTDSHVKTIRLKCVEHSPAFLANTSSRERASFKHFPQGVHPQMPADHIVQDSRVLMQQAGGMGFKVVSHANTVYMQGVPFYSLIELEIALSGEWMLRIAAFNGMVEKVKDFDLPHSSKYQEIIIRRGIGNTTIPLTLKWDQQGDIYMILTVEDLSSKERWHIQKHYTVKVLDDASYITADPSRGEELQELAADDDEVQGMLGWAVEEMSSSRRIEWLHVHRAVLLANFPLKGLCKIIEGQGGGEGVGEVEGAGSWSCSLDQLLSEGGGSAGKGGGGEGDGQSGSREVLGDAEKHITVYITVEAYVRPPDENGYAALHGQGGRVPGGWSVKIPYLLAVQRFVGFVSDVRKGAHSRAPTLLHAQEVSVNLIAPKQRLEELTNLGVCRAAEPQIDEDLAPWEATGSVISEDIVRDMASRSVCSRYCNRVLVVNGSLHIVWAHQDQEHESTSHGRKWYTTALLEILTSVMSRVVLPDVDLCVAEEGPQVLRGGNQAVLTATRSAAHMDILVPDLFFRYWETPARLVPHPWYKPPINFASLTAADGSKWQLQDGGVGVEWDARIPKVYWRGTIDEWAISARGRLCRLAGRRPDLFDVQPLRIVGRALHQWLTFPDEEMRPFEAAIRRGGGGINEKSDAILAYKFVINVHGNGIEWSNRLRTLLSSGALVFKQEATLFEFWEREMQPMVHYVPIRSDFSNLIKMVEWALDNDDLALEIAQNAVAFVRERLHLNRVQCYWARLLSRYSAIQDFKPTLPPDAVALSNVASSLWK